MQSSFKRDWASWFFSTFTFLGLGILALLLIFGLVLVVEPKTAEGPDLYGKYVSYRYVPENRYLVPMQIGEMTIYTENVDPEQFHMNIQVDGTIQSYRISRHEFETIPLGSTYRMRGFRGNWTSNKSYQFVNQ